MEFFSPKSKKVLFFSAKIIYENTIFAKKFRACGAKMKDLAKILENKGGSYLRGFLIRNSTDI